MLLGDNPASFPYLCARARVVSHMNGTDIRMFIMAGLDVPGLQSKLLITPLSECSLKSVTTTLCLLFSWLHILHCIVVGNLASIPSYSCLVYDTMIMQFYY